MKRARLRKHVLELLGEHPETTIPVIKEGVRRFYPDHDSDVSKVGIDEVLLELEQAGLVKITTNDSVAVTSFGAEEVRRLKLRNEEKGRLKREKQAREKQKVQSKRIHEDLKLKVGELANLLGKVWKPEHALTSRPSPVIVDVVWYAKPGEVKISHAFEIQYHGNMKNAIHNLERVVKYHLGCKLFLVVKERKEMGRIKKLLGPTYQKEIWVIEAQQLEGWLKVLKSPETSGVLKTMKDVGLL